MSKLVLNGDTSGSVTLDAPAISGTTTLTLPTTSGTIVASDTSGNVGIGTTSPGSRLEVSSSATSAAAGFTSTNTNSDGYSTLQLKNTGASGRTYTIALGGNTSANPGIFYVYDDTAAANRLNITSTGLLQFNSGYGSAATAYGCRAWVNFDGTSNTANLTGTYSQSGTTVTVTVTNHGLIAGSVIFADATTGTAVDGTYTVATVTSANVFTYTAGTSLTTSGNMTLRRNTIRGSGNVTSITDNGTGTYTVNFTTAMPDANYSWSGLAGSPGVTNGYQIIGTPLAASVPITTLNTALALFDPTYVTVMVMR